MSFLRHPVVITSLEEDFRKIGLITERREEEVSNDTDEELEGEDDSELEAEAVQERRAALAEAVEFHEAFKMTWAELGEEGIETIYLSDKDMGVLESLASEVTELPAGVIEDDPIAEDDEELEEQDDEDDEDDEYDEDEEEDDEDEEETESRSAFESVAVSLRSIESILAKGGEGPAASIAEAIPAFANLALVAERLHDFFLETSKLQEDVEYASIATNFAVIAKYAAGIVDVLKEEDEDTIDLDSLQETFADYLKTTMQGLETYAILREADNDLAEKDSKCDDEDEDSDSDDEEETEGVAEGNS